MDMPTTTEKSMRERTRDVLVRTQWRPYLNNNKVLWFECALDCGAIANMSQETMQEHTDDCAIPAILKALESKDGPEA
jgi:hypothetical protein